MSWNDLTAEHQHNATKHLTPKQLDIYKLHLAGCSHRRIATMLGISPTTAKDHVHRALNKLHPEKETA